MDKLEEEKDKGFLKELYGDLLSNEFEVDLLQLKVEELRQKIKNQEG